MNPTKTLFMQLGRKRYQVASLQEASEKFCAARNASGFGASRIASPLIVDDRGATVGYVAYNGRVFSGTPQTWETSTKLFYDNRASEG